MNLASFSYFNKLFCPFLNNVLQKKKKIVLKWVKNFSNTICHHNFDVAMVQTLLLQSSIQMADGLMDLHPSTLLHLLPVCYFDVTVIQNFEFEWCESNRTPFYIFSLLLFSLY